MGFQRMVDANNAKETEVDNTVAELRKTNSVEQVVSARWAETFEGIPERLADLDQHVATILHLPPAYLGILSLWSGRGELLWLSWGRRHICALGKAARGRHMGNVRTTSALTCWLGTNDLVFFSS